MKGGNTAESKARELVGGIVVEALKQAGITLLWESEKDMLVFGAKCEIGYDMTEKELLGRLENDKSERNTTDRTSIS